MNTHGHTRVYSGRGRVKRGRITADEGESQSEGGWLRGEGIFTGARAAKNQANPSGSGELFLEAPTG